MLSRTCSRLHLSVAQACSVMGFDAPPLERKALRRRFVELVKKHHPDGDGPGSSGEHMIRVTEACQTLQRLLDCQQRAAGVCVSSSGVHPGGGGISTFTSGTPSRRGSDYMRREAASFVAPGVPLSVSSCVLPWQRGKTRKARQRERLQEDAASLCEFVRLVRASEREEWANSKRVDAALRSSEGSHGFTCDHFETVHRTGRRWRGTWCRNRRRPLPMLIWVYYRRKLRMCFVRCWAATRFIVSGQ
ncbi:hypothetical protein ERJ75_001326900 [Trypanosoma vivax]|uniref:Putative chaperone protein DNAj n=1 Tax=Trypanosoma vivax (strain Y486) TaxID=1055687 RepID=G0U130_TRYVY|nr:putative chaperone protein DNAj [Trypanosoma vivax]KAH8607843.1 hypothetical protein ERJ75_001326900 [Trypanosoma vivax]CCC49785.1 putative chaperone protein DNAj [Trypanosoma vivax Y486]